MVFPFANRPRFLKSIYDITVRLPGPKTCRRGSPATRTAHLELRTRWSNAPLRRAAPLGERPKPRLQAHDRPRGLFGAGQQGPGGTGLSEPASEQRLCIARGRGDPSPKCFVNDEPSSAALDPIATAPGRGALDRRTEAELLGHHCQPFHAAGPAPRQRRRRRSFFHLAQPLWNTPADDGPRSLHTPSDNADRKPTSRAGSDKPMNEQPQQSIFDRDLERVQALINNEYVCLGLSRCRSSMRSNPCANARTRNLRRRCGQNELKERTRSKREQTKEGRRIIALRAPTASGNSAPRGSP